jgi:HEAT repeat protein
MDASSHNQADARYEIPPLIAGLASSDPLTRARSRETLVRIGGSEVSSALMPELSDPREHVRWEAAKALVALRDPVAAPALLEALDDENLDVRWVAAEGLIELGRTGLLAVLYGLTKKSQSVDFCRSAHHVLHKLAERESSYTLEPVLAALEQEEPAVSVPPVAYSALWKLKIGHG